MTEEPPSEPPRSLRRVARSFRYAFRGLQYVLATQPNARVHAGLSVTTIALGFWLGLTRIEWCLVIGAIGLVWTAEALNTVLETVVDLVSPDHHPLAGRIKDVAAGAVLCAAITALILGVAIFFPKLVALFR